MSTVEVEEPLANRITSSYTNKANPFDVSIPNSPRKRRYESSPVRRTFFGGETPETHLKSFPIPSSTAPSSQLTGKAVQIDLTDPKVGRNKKPDLYRLPAGLHPNTNSMIPSITSTKNALKRYRENPRSENLIPTGLRSNSESRVIFVQSPTKALKRKTVHKKTKKDKFFLI